MRKTEQVSRSRRLRRATGGPPASMPVLEALETRQLLSVTISTPLLFTGPVGPTVLDNNPLYDSNLALGSVQIADDLIMSGTGSILANDPASPANNSATPIILDVTGSMTMGTGTSIFAENRLSGGSGGAITLTVGKNLLLQSGSIISSSRTTASGTGNGGNLLISVAGGIDLQTGSIVAANNAGSGKAGNITILDTSITPVSDQNPAAIINIDGLVSAGPSTTLLANRLLSSSLVLAGGNTTQKGGNITIKNVNDTGNADPTLARIVVSTTGVVVSQGQDPSSGLITLESQCAGITINGLVASVAAKQHGSTTNWPQVIMRSPRFIEINGSDLGGQGPNQGRVRADYAVGEGTLANHPQEVDLYARSYIKVAGPSPLTGDLFAVSAFGGTATNQKGGVINAFAVGDPSNAALGTVTAVGNAFDASATLSGGGGVGGKINVTSANGVTLDGARLRAFGALTGGKINVGTNGNLSWQNGVGDVRKTGGGAALANRGVVTLTALALANINDTGTSYPVTSGAQTNAVKLAGGVDIGALETLLNLPVCRGHGGDCAPAIDTILLLDVDTTVNFNTAIPTYIGDADLLPYFSWSKPNLADPSTWMAKFNLPYNVELEITDGTVLTTSRVGGGNNQYAPGIEIEAGQVVLDSDADKNLDGGGTILVSSFNKAAGHIFVRTGRDIQVFGSIINEVVGTNGTPGEIILQTHCGEIVVGPSGRVETRGVDHGGADIVIVNGEEGSEFTGNIVINGLVRATYKGQAEGVIPTIDIVNFKLPGNIVIDGRNNFQVKEGNTTINYTSGVRVQSLRDPIAGTINIQAVNSVTVLGNDNHNSILSGAFGTVAVKTASSSPVGGTINVVVLGRADVPGSGTLSATDRAFDNAGRYNKDATVTLRAAGLINLQGTTNNVLAVVDNKGTGGGGQGGKTIIHSYNGSVTVGPKASVLATGVTPGTNTLVGSPVTILGTVNPANSGTDPVALAPLFPTLASLGHGLTYWGPWLPF